MSKPVPYKGEEVVVHGATLYPTFGMASTRIWDRWSGNLVPYMGPDLTEALGGYLAQRIERDKLTFKQLEDMSGIPASTLERIKNVKSNVGINNLEGIAKAFGMRPWELLKEIDSSKSAKESATDVFVVTSPDEVGPLSDTHKHFLTTVKSIMGRIPEKGIKAIDKLMWAFVPEIEDEAVHSPSKKPAKKKAKA